MAYAGEGDAPGVKFENCLLVPGEGNRGDLHRYLGRRSAAERNQGGENQPWHWVAVIPAMGLTMGEMFYLKDLAAACATDKVYEFFFCGPPLVITGATGSPINPQAAIK